MATKKGTTVVKTSTEMLRLEILSPHDKSWGWAVDARVEDEEQVKHLNSIANSLKSGPVKYRVVKSTTTTRVATSETIIEGEGMEKAPAKTTPPPKP